MSLSEDFLDTQEIHPIDIVEHLANHNSWDFDRVGEDQIAMAVVGQWRTYSVTLAWSAYDETLRLICTFELEPPADKLSELFHILNVTNDRCWAGAFSYWDTQKLMTYRYGLVLSGGQTARPEQIDCMISAAIAAAERYYPAFQLATWGGRSVDDAIQIAIGETYGTA